MTKLTIAKARRETIRPIVAYMMVFLAAVTLEASPADMEYLTPPKMMKPTLMIPMMKKTMFMIIEMMDEISWLFSVVFISS